MVLVVICKLDLSLRHRYGIGCDGVSIEGQSWSEFLLTSLKPLVTMEAKQSLCSAVEPDSFNKVKMFVAAHCSDFSFFLRSLYQCHLIANDRVQ